MRRVAAVSGFFFLVLVGLSQIAPDKYFVQFTDKNNSPYTLDKPWEFLTQRALDRRSVAGIPVAENDVPVTPDYIEAVRLIGVDILTHSRWFNGITIYTTDTAKISEIELLPFVSEITKTGSRVTKRVAEPDKFDLEQAVLHPNLHIKIQDSADYGLSFTQVHMVRTDYLHTLGYRGDGMVIAVLDAGFNLVDHLAPFDSLWANNQILGTRDFVTPGGNVFIGHTHGMSVLSIMGGNVPGQLIGTAPKAAYWLLRSEDAGSEYLVEEYNWVSAAEFADSVGADVINSSLGYTVFNDTTQNHTCADMTGNTTPVTRGANIAFSKGILVVNSAGNEGNTASWQCVSAPSDGTGVLGVGAVDSLGNYASFSSKGIVEGTYVKPNVAAMGRLTVLSGPDGIITRGNGTSFSSPVMAGSAACLWQAFPGYSNATLKSAIEHSASQFMNPDIFLGFGIPNMQTAYQQLTGITRKTGQEFLHLYPNPSFTNEPVHVEFETMAPQKCQIQWMDITGRILRQIPDIQCSQGNNVITISDLSFLKQGVYIVKVQNQDGPSFVWTRLIQRLDH